MLKPFAALFACLWLAQAALAGAPDRSVRPTARPVEVNSFTVRRTSVPVSYHATVRPPRRAAQGAASPARPEAASVISGYAVVRSPRPGKRPKTQTRVTQRVSQPTPQPVSQPAPVISTRRNGSVCRDRAIRGQKIARIKGQLSGCGVANPVEITAIDGVLLSQPAIMDCTTAKALKNWVHNGAKPAVGRLGGGIRSLRVAAHYACRTRNSQPGAKISEHGKGRAIDISAIELNNGVSLTVLEGWKIRRQSKILKRMHKAACGPFGTVLGPDSDSFHRNHFHFDTAKHRNGSYCR